MLHSRASIGPRRRSQSECWKMAKEEKKREGMRRSRGEEEGSHGRVIRRNFSENLGTMKYKEGFLHIDFHIVFKKIRRYLLRK